MTGSGYARHFFVFVFSALAESVLTLASAVAAEHNFQALRRRRNTSGFFVVAPNHSGGCELKPWALPCNRKYLNGRNLAASQRACGALRRDLSNASAC